MKNWGEEKDAAYHALRRARRAAADQAFACAQLWQNIGNAHLGDEEPTATAKLSGQILDYRTAASKLAEAQEAYKKFTNYKYQSWWATHESEAHN